MTVSKSLHYIIQHTFSVDYLQVSSSHLETISMSRFPDFIFISFSEQIFIEHTIRQVLARRQSTNELCIQIANPFDFKCRKLA